MYACSQDLGSLTCCRLPRDIQRSRFIPRLSEIMKILPRFTLSDSTLAETRRLSVNFLWWDYSPWMRKLRDAVVIRPSFIITQWAVQQQRVLGGRSSFATMDETLQTDLVFSKTRALNSGISQKTGRRHRGVFSDINVQSGHLITRASNS